MKKLELVICDQDSDYITKFGSYLLGRFGNVNIHIYTTPESFFSDERDFDLAILTEDFEEVANFKNKGNIGKKYFLVEEKTNDENRIFKYQSMELIIKKIPEINKIQNVKVGTISTEKSNIYGVYSPISHELQLPFSMALSKSLENHGRVLFLPIEELSIMPGLIGENVDNNLMDCLYEISTSNTNFKLSKYIHQFMGFDYINPFSGPDEITQIDEGTWEKLFSQITRMNYDTIVVLFGRAIEGFTEIIGKLDKLYVLGRPGDYFKKGMEAFENYLDKTSIEVAKENVLLPMSAVNLTEGTYCIEELMQGNLGLFVKHLLDEYKKEQVA